MRIWHFCPSPVSVSREQGGVANVVRALSVEMARSGLDVTVVCGDRELGRRMQPPGQQQPMPGLRIVTLRQRGNPALGPVGEVSLIAKSLGNGDDVAHIHTCFSAFSEAAMRTLRRADVPFVFSAHGKLSEAALRNRGLAKRLWWAALSKRRIAAAARIGAFASGEADDARRAGLVVPTVMIPNGCVPPEGEGWRTASPIPSRYVLFLGYLDPRKRPELLIEAFAGPGMPGDVLLVLAGPDHYGHGDHLRRLARQAGIEERVLFAGPVHGVGKWSLIAGATCLCLPSRAEGMPLVLAEAVGARTPIVVSPQCNASAITDAGAGIEVGEASAEAWSAAIRSLLDAPARTAIMREAAARIAPGYRWDSIAARWVETYRAIAAERRQEALISGRTSQPSPAR